MTDDPLNLSEKLVRQFVRGGKRRRLAYELLKWRGVEFPTTVPFGEGLRLPHDAVGLVVHPNTVIGKRVKLYQAVTLGRSDIHVANTAEGGQLIIGDDVVIGAGAVVLFRSGQTITIGDGAVIGANSVVNRNVGAGETWAGVPARKLDTDDIV